MSDASRLREVAGRCADKVFADMGVTPGDNLESVLDLYDRWGVRLVWDNFADYCGGGCYWRLDFGNYIVLSPDLPKEKAATVALHELAHHVVYSDAYDHLNYEEYFADFDPRQFREAFAREIEFRFSGVRR